MGSPVFSTRARPLVIGHRGASGHATENSLAAFRLASGDDPVTRCDGVELDIHTTSDGQFVVHHDSVLATGEAISVVPLSTVRARQLSDGSRIPTLGEALDVLANTEVFVEAKGLPLGAEPSLLAMLAGHRNARYHIHAFDHRIIARLHRLDARLSLGVLSASYPVDPIAPVQRAGAGTLWQQCDLIDAALVSACHSHGIALIAWTVDERDQADSLAALGVDGLCGNWPERLRQARKHDAGVA